MGRCGLEHTANQTSNLEEKDGYQERDLQGKVFIYFPPCGLETSQRDEERGTIPRFVFNTTKFIGDLWNGCCHNCLGASRQHAPDNI